MRTGWVGGQNKHRTFTESGQPCPKEYDHLRCVNGCPLHTQDEYHTDGSSQCTGAGICWKTERMYTKKKKNICCVRVKFMSVRINAGKKGQVNPEASICVNSRRCVSRWCVCVCAYVWALGTCLTEQVWNLAANWLDSAAPQNRARHDQIQEGFFLRSMNCKRKSANAVRPLHFVASLVFLG